MPETILNPLIALGGLMGLVAVIALLIYVNDRFFKGRKKAKKQQADFYQAVATQERPAIYAPPAFFDVSGTMPIREWMGRINHQPDKTPHLAVTGPSGSGKTTFVLSILADRPGRLVIATPKAQRTDPWGGFPAVRLNATDMSYAPLGSAIKAVYAEMLRRNAHNSETTDDWLTLAIDDYSTVVGELPDLKPTILRMLTLGRSVRIRLVIIDTETNVKAWGIEGRGEARNNLIYVELEEDTHAARMFRWKERDQPVSLDVGAVPEIVAHARLTGRAWLPVSKEAEQPALLALQSAKAWTDDHLKIITWLLYEPDISNREIGRRLNPGTDGGGDYAVKAKRLRDEVSEVLEDALLGVRARSNTHQERVTNN
jgi:energy-coupling factor transporter ATP-binding protein EcfA2